MRGRPDNVRVSKASTEAKQARNAAEAHALHARTGPQAGGRETCAGPQAGGSARGAAGGRETRYVCVLMRDALQAALFAAL